MTKRSHGDPRIPLAIALCLIYALSVGPYGWLLSRFDLSLGEFIAWMVPYYPLGWLADQSDSFGRLLQWYISFWY